MTMWLRRNIVPILIVVAAAVMVIAGSELLDALVGSSSPAAGTAAEGEGAPSLAGLIKVALFMAMGAGLARIIRRRLDRRS